MTYQYENLDDERFQQLGQAVLVHSFPNAQCLPVGQPDGGRDAFNLRRVRDSQSELIVFQVKFSRAPDLRSERDSLDDLIKREATKVRRLKAKGASAYYLITNVRGTAHLDGGSVDRINERLTKEFDLPSFCWWRDDLDARINGNGNIKWSFPEIIRGSDVLQLLVEGNFGEGATNRNAALRSYIANQHQEDQEVKFKQVELQNKIVNLFVDLPIAPIGAASQTRRYISGVFVQAHRTFNFSDSEFLALDHTGRTYRHLQPPNAANFLLHLGYQELQKIVLEGAPGQGKSTITQYLCQVNRIKLLDSSVELSLLPDNHRNAPVRVPFRVDLRDYASWLSGRNPFATDLNAPASSLAPGLESFIAAQVSRSSGGHQFLVSDLIAIAKSSHILIVLDGFDEVADIATRRRVVEEISKAAARIHANAKSAQILVTSRSAPFANSPGFSEGDWSHFELLSMTPEQIDQYSQKWMSARSLPTREKEEFSKLLKEKLEQPHTRDLARNPMQLTILLALVHQRGLSLPDKRTALYDSYMELFFNREAEKSRVVREQRDLLINIHRYLAWVLQVEAERGSSDGSISEAELKLLLERYLRSEGHPTTLVQELFTGMVERVVALVSRVQGTFEFEVQPLREYFAARHLYETAPYSPPGKEQSGTKPERFEVLARNFYWLNVVRFYAGCFSRGELSALADGIDELEKSEDFRHLSHPRILALMLLGDWVFSQHPLAVKRVVSSLFEPTGFKILVSSARSPRPVSVLSLPEKCGRDELIELLSQHLRIATRKENRISILSMLRENMTRDERYSWWQEQEAKVSTPKLWLVDGGHLGLFDDMGNEEFSPLVAQFGGQLLAPVSAAERFDLIYSHRELFDAALESILSGNWRTFEHRRRSRDGQDLGLENLASFLSPMTYRNVLSNQNETSAKRAMSRFGLPLDPKFSAASEEPPEGDANLVRSVIDVFEQQLDLGTQAWISALQPWNEILKVGYQSFGHRWAFCKFGVLAAGIKSEVELGEWHDSAWKGGANLASSMRYARRKSGNVSWWSEQIAGLKDDDERVLAALALAVWATPRTMIALGSVASELFDSLTPKNWKSVHDAAGEILWTVEGLHRSSISVEHFRGKKNSLRLLLMLALRSRRPTLLELYVGHFKAYRGTDPNILVFCCEMAVMDALEDNSKWSVAIKTLEHAYAHNISEFPMQDGGTISTKAAREILSNSIALPQSIVFRAERQLAATTGASAPKLGDAAAQAHWFST